MTTPRGVTPEELARWRAKGPTADETVRLIEALEEVTSLLKDALYRMEMHDSTRDEVSTACGIEHPVAIDRIRVFLGATPDPEGPPSG